MNQVYTLKETESDISNAKDVFDNINKFNIDYEQENLIVFCLNTRNDIIHSEILFKGGVDSCLIDSKTLFRVALKFNSSNIIIAHNHPSGQLTPSPDDIEIFKKLKQGGKLLQLPVLDSIIFNKTEYYSIAMR